MEAALSLEGDMFKKKYRFGKPSLDADIVFSCRSGRRSRIALGKASKLGYSK